MQGPKRLLPATGAPSSHSDPCTIDETSPGDGAALWRTLSQLLGTLRVGAQKALLLRMLGTGWTHKATCRCKETARALQAASMSAAAALLGLSLMQMQAIKGPLEAS